MNYARLNHILIPTTKEDRDRWRKTAWSRFAFGPLMSTWFALSDEGRILLGFTLVAGLAGLDVERSETHALWALLISLILTSLAVRRAFRLSHVRLEVSGPERVAVGEPAHFTVTLHNQGERPHFGIRVERPFLPWDGKWQDRAPRLAEVPGQQHRSVPAIARFAARGAHHIDSFSAAALVPLGLALGPRTQSTGLRFTVVPRVARVRMPSLALSACHQPGGIALASHTGESMELIGVRPYRPGDALRDLHAVTWARTGKPSVREYRQEYFTRVGVVFDTDPAGANEQRFEAGVCLVAGIVARLCSGEELIDLLVTGAQTRSFTLGRSLGRLDQALDHLAEVEAGEFDADAQMAAVQPHLERLSAVVFVAFEWDARRLALVREIERCGVGCRTVIVTDSAASSAAERAPDSTSAPLASAPADSAGPIRVDVDAVIEACHAGEELVL